MTAKLSNLKQGFQQRKERVKGGTLSLLEHSVFATRYVQKQEVICFFPLLPVTGKGKLLVPGLSGQSAIRNQVLQSKVKIDLQFISISVYSIFQSLKKNALYFFLLSLFVFIRGYSLMQNLMSDALLVPKSLPCVTDSALPFQSWFIKTSYSHQYLLGLKTDGGKEFGLRELIITC